MYSEVAWVLVSSRTQVQLQMILEPGYLPDYLSVSYDYDVASTLSLCIEPDTFYLVMSFCQTRCSRPEKIVKRISVFELNAFQKRLCSKPYSHDNVLDGVPF